MFVQKLQLYLCREQILTTHLPTFQQSNTLAKIQFNKKTRNQKLLRNSFKLSFSDGQKHNLLTLMYISS